MLVHDIPRKMSRPCLACRNRLKALLNVILGQDGTMIRYCQELRRNDLSARIRGYWGFMTALLVMPKVHGSWVFMFPQTNT